MVFLFNYVYMCRIVYVLIDSCACRGQKRISDPLKLKLEMTGIYLVWVLGPSCGPLKEQYTLLTAESSPQPHHNIV